MNQEATSLNLTISVKDGQDHVDTAIQRHAHVLLDGAVALDDIPPEAHHIQLVINLDIANYRIREANANLVVIEDMKRKNLEISKFIYKPFLRAKAQLQAWIDNPARAESDRTVLDAALFLKYTNCLILFGYAVQRGLGKQVKPQIAFDEAISCAFILGMQATIAQVGDLEPIVEGKEMEKARKKLGQALRSKNRGLPSDEQLVQVASDIVAENFAKTGKQISLKPLKSKIRARLTSLGLTIPGEWKMKQVANTALIKKVCEAAIQSVGRAS
jgi:hypothetical protein